MAENKYSEMSDEQLLVEKKKLKSTKLISGVIIAVSFLAFVLAAVKNGMSFLTFLPLAFAYLAMKIQEKTHALEATLNTRGLE